MLITWGPEGTAFSLPMACPKAQVLDLYGNPVGGLLGAATKVDFGPLPVYITGLPTTIKTKILK